MFDVRIFVNNEQVDVELAGLPLVFTREIDKWGDFIGSEGTRAKPLNDTLYLPATKRNNAVLAQFVDAQANSLDAQGKLPIYVEVNGVRVFTGWAQRASAVRSAVQAKKYALRILGDSVDIMQQLEGVSLRDLELGEFVATSANILDTWSGVADTTRTTVWQPVIYGGIWVDVFLVADTFSYRLGLRPAVRIWRILQAIFEERFGYEIQSTLYETEAFRNLLYLYGVGDDWERTDDVTPYTCFVGAQAQTYLASPAFVKFTREAAPFFDAQGLNAFGVFEPPTSGWYRMEFSVRGNNVQTVRIIGDYTQPGSPIFTQRELATGIAGETIVIEELLFEPTYGLTRVRVEVESTVLPIGIDDTSTYNARLLTRFAYGSTLRIASCLHDRPVKEFLRGLQHMFGLVFAIDNLNKVVRIDPRFVNNIQPSVVPRLDGVLGYYDTQAEQPQELRADVEEVSIENRRPFGDYLTLQYGDDSGDAALGEIERQIGDTFAAPLYGQKTFFIEAAKKGTELPNPYFTPAANALITQFSVPTASELQRLTQWICIADSVDELRLFSSEMYYADDYMPSRSSAPKIAVYYGLFDFSAPEYFQKYELGFRASLASLSEVLTTFPAAFQVFPDDAGYHQVFGDVPFHIPYATPEFGNPSRVTTYSLGLIDRFHQKYLAAIYRDKWYSLRIATDTRNYLLDYFTSPKALRLQGIIRKCWQASTQGYAPLESQTADIELIEDADVDSEDAYTYEANRLIPTLIIGGQVQAIIEIPSFDVAALAFLLATGITDPTIQDATNTLVINLKDNGLWTLMQAIYPMVGGTAFTHKFNLKDPQDLNTSFRLQFFGGGTHSVNGYLPNGVNAYADTFYTPDTSAPAADDMHLSYFSRTTSTGTYVEMGCNGSGMGAGAGQTYIAPAVGANSGRAVNTNGNTPGTAFASKAYSIASRTDSVFYRLHQNGALVANDSSGANNLSNRSIKIGARDNNGVVDGFSNRECIFATIGYGLTDVEITTLNTIVQNFQTALGGRQL